MMLQSPDYVFTYVNLVLFYVSGTVGTVEPLKCILFMWSLFKWAFVLMLNNGLCKLVYCS